MLWAMGLVQLLWEHKTESNAHPADFRESIPVTHVMKEYVLVRP